MSFKLKLNSINFNCAPMVTEGFNGDSNLLGYMCKSTNSRNIEGFENAEAYDNNKPYKVGDVVSYQGSIFKMIEGAGPPGYAPDREGDKLWELVSGPGNKVHPGKGPAQYDNNKAYVVGDVVTYQGSVFKMIEGAGPPGYAPDREGDKLWELVSGPGNNVHPGKQSEPVRKAQVQAQDVQMAPAKQNQPAISGSVKYVRLGGGNDWINLSQLVVTDSNGVNVAKGRPTTSSGVHGGGEESNAVDGDEQSRHHPKGYHSSSDKNAFFQVTLDKPTSVASVTVYARADFGGRMAGHKISLLDSNNNVLYTSDILTGELKQTINIPKSKTPAVCGVNSNDDIYCAYENIDNAGIKWFKLPGSLTNVSISNGRLYGTNNGDMIYYTDDYKNADWTEVPGGLNQVSLDAQTPVVVGVNDNDTIFYADKNIHNKPNWTQIGGALINISVSNKKLYGCNRNNDIYYAADYKNPQWIKIPGSLKQVSLDGYYNVVCGVNKNNDVYCANVNIYSKDIVWNKLSIPEKFIWVSVSNGKIYAVAQSQNIYFAAGTVNPQWIKIPGALKQVSFDNY